MQAIKMTVTLCGFVLTLLSWQPTDSVAAETTALAPSTERELSPIQKRLIDLGFRPPGEEEPLEIRLSRQANAGVVQLMSGEVDGIDMQVAADLAMVLDDAETLRILPIIGKGSGQNITDLLYLKGIDLCIVQSDVMSYLMRQKTYPTLNRYVHYVTKLYSEEVHLLVRQNVQTIQDLSGQKVNFGPSGSETNITASTVFDTLEIAVEPTHFDSALALEKLKQGEIAGMVYVAVKPARLFQDVTAEDAIHFVPIPVTAALLNTYSTSGFTTADYPGLIPPDRQIVTLAVATTLGTYNWSQDSPRYHNVAQFVDAFFSRLAEFQQPSRHPTWTEVNLADEVPGWTRFKAATDWLKQNQQIREEELRASIMQFLSGQTTPSGTQSAPNQ